MRPRTRRAAEVAAQHREHELLGSLEHPLRTPGDLVGAGLRAADRPVFRKVEDAHGREGSGAGRRAAKKRPSRPVETRAYQDERPRMSRAPGEPYSRTVQAPPPWKVTSAARQMSFEPLFAPLALSVTGSNSFATAPPQ